jgi:hypothetical protein
MRWCLLAVIGIVGALLASRTVLSAGLIEVIQVSPAEARAVRGGDDQPNCYITPGCPIAESDCTDHCGDVEGCEDWTTVPFSDPTPSQPGNGLSYPECVEEEGCTYADPTGPACNR